MSVTPNLLVRLDQSLLFQQIYYAHLALCGAEIFASEISGSGIASESLPIPPAIHLESRNREAIPHLQPLVPAVVIASEGALLE